MSAPSLRSGSRTSRRLRFAQARLIVTSRGGTINHSPPRLDAFAVANPNAEEGARFPPGAPWIARARPAVVSSRRPEREAVRARSARHNNFDAARLLAASAVVFSHAFLIG